MQKSTIGTSQDKAALPRPVTVLFNLDGIPTTSRCLNAGRVAMKFVGVTLGVQL